MAVATVSVKEAAGRTAGALVDVRTSGEFASGHAQGAVSVPLDKVTPEAVKAAVGLEGPVYLICKGGGRSARAAEVLTAAGMKDVYNVDGGTQAWEAAGLPVVRGTRKVLSLDRQVQLVVGPLALIGGILGFTVHQGFFVVPTLIGLGLTIAGATGFCGMGMLLGRMPWNRR